MTNGAHVPDVGTPDPDLNTSPIALEGDEDTAALREELPGEPGCYFNGAAFRNGDYVRSGTSLLRCNWGIWVEAGSADPDNP